MKKHISMILAAGLALSMTACSAPSRAETSPASQETTRQTANPTAETTAQAAAESAAPDRENTLAAAEETAEGSRTLIAYFSRWGNTEYPSDVDATSSASIVADGSQQYGTTEYMAHLIQEQTGGELHLIQTEAPYPVDFQEVVDQNHSEMGQNALPELKASNLDMSAYDTVFIGYPKMEYGFHCV